MRIGSHSRGGLRRSRLRWGAATSVVAATTVVLAMPVGVAGASNQPLRRARSAELASRSGLSLSQAPAGLQAAVRRTLGPGKGPLSAAFQRTELTVPGARGFGQSVAISGSTAVVGAGYPGAAYVFVRSGTSWSEQAKLTVKSTAWSVAIYGATVVVGAPDQNSRTGAVYVFVRSGTTWTRQATLTEPHAAAGDFFGGAVTIYKSTAVVDAPFTNSNRGAAYVFVRSGTTWTPQATLTEPHGGGEAFGDGAVAIYGATLVAGSGNNAAYVFVRSGTTWTQQAKLTEPHATKGDCFGCSAGVYKSTAVVGDPFKDSGRGAVYVFVRSGATWTQQAELTGSDAVGGVGGDQVGGAVAISGAKVIAGAYHGNSFTGKAYVFMRSGTTWKQEAELTEPHPAKDDLFGLRVALSGSTAVVAASGENSSKGAAYVFVGL